MRTRVANIARGRYVRRGLTWRSAVLALLAIAAVTVGLGTLAGILQPDYPITIGSTGDRVVGEPGPCSWEVDLTFRNDSDRRLRLLSVEAPAVEDSRRGVIGVFGPGETMARTYRVDLDDCVEPATTEFVVRYGPAMTTKERSVAVDLGAAPSE